MMPTVINLDPDRRSELILVKIGGHLIAEVALGTLTSTRDNLEAEVRKARGLESLHRFVESIGHEIDALEISDDHTNKTPQKRQAAFARGLADGLAGRTVPHPDGPAVPPIPCESTKSYRTGYHLGDAMRRAIAEREGG